MNISIRKCVECHKPVVRAFRTARGVCLPCEFKDAKYIVSLNNEFETVSVSVEVISA